jgi:hypothetical protein
MSSVEHVPFHWSFRLAIPGQGTNHDGAEPKRPPICGLMAPDIPIHPHLPHLLLRMRGSVEGMRTARMAEYRTEEETRDRRELEDSEAMLVIDLAAGSGV